MEKTNGYYVAKYLKNNALVLLCELVVVLLLSLICTIIMEAEPLWRAPVIAVVTYLIAEVRFMMAYVATNARHEHDMAVAKGELAEDEQRNEQEPAQEEPTPVTDAALFVAAAAAVAEQDEEPAEQDEESDEPVVEPEADEDDQEVENVPEAEDDQAATVDETPEAEMEPETDDVEQLDGEDMAEPVFEEAPLQTSLDLDEEDEAMDALFGAPLSRQEEQEADIVLESIDMADDELDGMTMDGDDFARDVLEIGEIETTAAADDEQ